MKRILPLLLLIIISKAFAQENTLRLPSIYTDNMVLQRNIPLKITGEAMNGLEVSLKIKEQTYATVAGSNGTWEINLNPMKAGGPYTLEIATISDTLRFANVMIGEVWLCAGQSNMAFPLKQDIDFEKIKGKLENHLIRFYYMKPRWETYAVSWEQSALDSVNNYDYFKETEWVHCTESTAKEFSAIAYTFGKMLADSLNVPIGLIQNAVGGSPIEAWIDAETLGTGFPEIQTGWKENELIQNWVRERATLNISKSKNKNQKHPYQPDYLFTAGIRALHSYPVNGVIWYQGESNVHDQMPYDKLFPLLVDSWRNRWSNNELPFLYVQLSGMDRPLWPEFRDTQRTFMKSIPLTYMVVSSDKGDSLDVHPKEKQEIGKRLARWALNRSYGKEEIIPSGPLYRSVEFCGPYAYISFDYSSGLHTVDGKELRTFEVAGSDGIYHPAEATIEQERVKVKSEKVNDIRQVHYAWQPYTRANLVNDANLPTSTFKTENKHMELNQIIGSLPDYPVRGGISAPFTGVHNNRLIVVGGCNFPDVPASEGGKKVFYNDIYMLDLADNAKEKQWKKIGIYPFKVAYGSCINLPDGLICIGGQNEEGALSLVTQIRYDEEKADIIITTLPPLPVTHYNGDAVVAHNTLYVAGGVFAGDENVLYSLPLNDKNAAWKKITTNAIDNRQQPRLFAQNGQLFLTGGYNEECAEVFTDVLVFNFEKDRWEKYDRIMLWSEPPVTFIGTGSVDVENKTFFIGGTNYERFLSALQRIKKTKEAVTSGNEQLIDSLKQAGKDYMNQPADWYRFQPALIVYDSAKKQWELLGESEQLARAGAGVCFWENKLYVVGGEVKPGIRTEKAFSIDLEELGRRDKN